MNTLQKELILELRKLAPIEAASYLINQFPINPIENEYDNLMTILVVIEKLSWNKDSRKLLANYYLSDRISGNQRVYDCFIKIMPIRELLTTLEIFIEKKDPRLWLLKYSLQSILEKSENYTDQDKALIHNFIVRIDAIGD